MKINTDFLKNCIGLGFKPRKARLVLVNGDSKNPTIRVEYVRRTGLFSEERFFFGADLREVLRLIKTKRREWGSSSVR